MDKENLKSEIDLYVINKVKEFRLKAGISQANYPWNGQVFKFIGAIESPRYRVKSASII